MSVTTQANNLAKLINLIPVCSEDRANISGVHCRVRGDSVEFTATNGHIMARVFVLSSLFEGNVLELDDKILSLEFLAALKRLKREAQYTTAEFNGAEFNGTAKLTMPGASVQEFHFLSEKFPDIDGQINADKYKSELKLTFNAEYLLTLAKALSDPENRRSAPSVTLHIQGEMVNRNDGEGPKFKLKALNPIYITKGSESGFAILMPMRG